MSIERVPPAAKYTYNIYYMDLLYNYNKAIRLIVQPALLSPSRSTALGQLNTLKKRVNFFSDTAIGDMYEYYIEYFSFQIMLKKFNRVLNLIE